MSGEDISRTGSYEVGVAIVPTIESVPTVPDDGHQVPGGSVPGYDDVFGRRKHPDPDHPDRPGRPVTLVERGDAAVRAATEAIAGQIGVTAQRIAEAIDQQVAPPDGQSLAIEEIEVTFGITLAAGVQALFTAQAQSSAQVTIRLSRQATAQGPTTEPAMTEPATTQEPPAEPAATQQPTAEPATTQQPTTQPAATQQAGS
jgi:hypothetical protein